MKTIYLFLGGIFGYVLSIFLSIFQNFGVAVIFFALFATAITIPFDIIQRKNKKKSEFLQKEQERIRQEYKDSENKDELNKELTKMYADNHYNPAPGCLSTILSFIILIGLFFAVISPLTSTLHIENSVIEKASENLETPSRYEQLAIIEEIKDGRDYSNYFSEEEISKIEYLGKTFSFFGIDLFNTATEDSLALIFAFIYIAFLLVRALLPVVKEMIKVKKEKKKFIPINVLKRLALSLIAPVLISTFVFFVPIAVVLYWISSSIFGIIESAVLDRKV